MSIGDTANFVDLNPLRTPRAQQAGIRSVQRDLPLADDVHLNTLFDRREAPDHPGPRERLP